MAGGTSLVDQLITEYIGVDKVSGVITKIAEANDALYKRVMNAAKSIEKAFEAMAAVGKRFGASIQSHLSAGMQSFANFTAFASHAVNVVSNLFRLIETPVRWAIDFGKNAAQAESAYISLQARLTGLTNSAETAGRVMKEAMAVAAPSPFTTEQLDNAAVSLEAYRVNSERLLPTLAKLGTAMGAGSEQMEMYVRSVGRLSQGEMLNLRELAEMGISKKDFAKFGIDAEEGGKAGAASATQMLAAFEKIVSSKFGSLLEAMKNTPQAKYASLRDAGEKVMRAIGDGVLKAEAPFMESATKVLNALAGSGVLDQVVQKLSGAFTSVFGGDSSQAVAKFAARVLSFLYDLPDALKQAGSYAHGVFDALMEDGRRVFAYLGALYQATSTNIGLYFDYLHERFRGIIEATQRGISSVIRSIADMMKSVAQFASPLLENIGNKLTELANRMAKGAGDLGKTLGFRDVAAPNYVALPSLPEMQKLPSLPGFSFGTKTAEFEQRLLAALNQPAQAIPDVSRLPFLRGDGDNNTLNRIMVATEKTAEHTRKELDVHSLLFGGGDRAAAGVSLLDIRPKTAAQTYRPSGPPKIEVQVGQARDYIERGLMQFLIANINVIARAVQTYQVP